MRRRGLGVVSTVLGVSLVLACGGDDASRADLTGAEAPDRSSGAIDAAATDSGADATATNDPATVRAALDELLIAYDGVRNQIVADPGIAADRDHRLIQEYVALFEPDSSFVEQVLAAWADNGEAGSSLQPYSPDLPALELRLDGDFETVTADEVEFPWCETHRYRVFESDRELEQVELAFQGGTGVAVRVDGQWRLRQMDAIAQLISCRSKGGSG